MTVKNFTKVNHNLKPGDRIKLMAYDAVFTVTDTFPNKVRLESPEGKFVYYTYEQLEKAEAIFYEKVTVAEEAPAVTPETMLRAEGLTYQTARGLFENHKGYSPTIEDLSNTLINCFGEVFIYNPNYTLAARMIRIGKYDENNIFIKEVGI